MKICFFEKANIHLLNWIVRLEHTHRQTHVVYVCMCELSYINPPSLHFLVPMPFECRIIHELSIFHSGSSNLVPFSTSSKMFIVVICARFGI